MAPQGDNESRRKSRFLGHDNWVSGLAAIVAELHIGLMFCVQEETGARINDSPILKLASSSYTNNARLNADRHSQWIAGGDLLEALGQIPGVEANAKVCATGFGAISVTL